MTLPPSTVTLPTPSVDWRIKITIFTRFLFCAMILLVLAVPHKYFDYPGTRGDTLSPIAWLIFGLTLCAVVQVIVDVSVQHYVGKSIERSIIISRSIHRLSFDHQQQLPQYQYQHLSQQQYHPHHHQPHQRSISIASTTARSSTHSELVHQRRPAKRPATNANANANTNVTSIVRIGEAIPMRDLQ